jgi:hypothetical protein
MGGIGKVVLRSFRRTERLSSGYLGKHDALSASAMQRKDVGKGRNEARSDWGPQIIQFKLCFWYADGVSFLVPLQL